MKFANWIVANLRNIAADRLVIRKSAEEMTDYEILDYIKSKNKIEIIYDSWDIKRELAEDNLWQPGNYRLNLISERGQSFKPDQHKTIALFKAGYSRYASEKYVILAQCFGQWPIASGNLDLLEPLQNKLSLITKIIYKD